MNIEFIGQIDHVEIDRRPNAAGDPRKLRLFVKMVAHDESYNEQSIYARVQGWKALMVKNHTDEFGNVNGVWKATLSCMVDEKEFNGKPVFRNLFHITDLEEVAEDPIKMDDLDDTPEHPEPVTPLQLPSRRTGFMSWLTSFKSI